jgi:hypothetical protein
MLTGPRGSSLLEGVLRYGPLAASLVAVAMSAVALHRSSAPRPVQPTEAPRAVASAPVVPRPLPPMFAPGAPPRVAPPAGAGPALPVVAPNVPAMAGDLSGGKPPSASVTATAAKLRVRADVLASLADASGELPKPVEARLLRAQAAGADVASRAGLDAQKRDTVADILVDYVIRTMREAPPPDPDGHDPTAALKQDALSAIRAAAGPDAVPPATAAIDGL